MAKLIIEQELVQAVVNYLQGRPFVEVHVLIPALLSLQPMPESEPVKEPLASAAKLKTVEAAGA